MDAKVDLKVVMHNI